MMSNESIQEGVFFMAATSTSMTNFVFTDPYLFVCEFKGEGP